MEDKERKKYLTERSPGYDAWSAGEEVFAHKVLEDAALAGALSSHHGDLGEVQADGDAGGGEHVLQQVHVVDHVPHALALQHPAFCLSACSLVRGNNLYSLDTRKSEIIIEPKKFRAGSQTDWISIVNGHAYGQCMQCS